ncbi:UNVERIFIED_CONTAM: hypothetical protein K2H54_016021 [Gekko kuhli]
MMSREDEEIPVTAVDSTEMQQQTTAALVVAVEPEGAERGAQTQASWAPLPSWAEPTWLLIPDLRAKRFAGDGTRQFYKHSFKEEAEHIHSVEDTEVEHHRREFWGVPAGPDGRMDHLRLH